MIHFCSFEDRSENVVGLKLLALSLERHCPDFVLHVLMAQDDEGLNDWFRRHCPHAVLEPFDQVGRGWGVKPAVLINVLGRVAPDEPVVWMDADIIVTADITAAMSDPSPEVIVVQQDIRRPFVADSGRAGVWGWAETRSLAMGVNTGTVRVTSRHKQLLAFWDKAMKQPPYLQAQTMGDDRPDHLRSDQDVLEGILVSNVVGGDRFPLSWLVTGRDQIHDVFHWSHTPRERLAALAGRHEILLVHALAHKPWAPSPGREVPDDVLRPYVQAARSYVADLEEPDLGWLRPQTAKQRIWTYGTGRNIHLAGYGFFLTEWLGRLRSLLPRRTRDRLYFVWWRWLKWPIPLWRVRRKATITLGGERLSFVDVRDTGYREWIQGQRLGRDEPKVTALLRSSLRPGDVYLDVGSYVGGYALLASRLVGGDGEVFAFEPDPDGRAKLIRNVAANDARNVRVVAAAVAGHTGTVSFAEGGSAMSHTTGETGDVAATTLDAFCVNEGIVAAVVKVDIEGAEGTALRLGACRETVRGARLVIIEVHAGVAFRAIEELAHACGKRVEHLDRRNADNYNVALVPS